MSQRNFALGKTNFIIIGIAIFVIILGFILMAGPSSSPEAFEPDIFSAKRIKIAPIVCLVGFLLVIVGILFPSKNNSSENIDTK
ncbi:MAG: DUF3098 domain-containing protein [Dysgonamonadaceae bacterium]|nr:DUF3098 domain-containing protein [Dysgonamonadaceae bacterium]MDD3309196.1 DUF3098 domain-containing protein [Dysgonamonadaceae bacterium]MDD3899701.1 DUF3098 domain-containing protein [Dysgonamonadaceae bacterium]MDD4398020.1 DUF3098 domain-containing protein [Dysgonamonadaceae bacterium]MEA5081612.1 DUF3098 domain-containing protein [Dysgonamonadaceae bacterium]